MICALIMAGGKGERFWPLSTDEKPKQFLKLLGEETMIQMTVRRVQTLIPLERIFVTTAKSYVDLVKMQLPDLPEKNIIVEPVGRNTAPSIALSAFIINKYYKDSVMIVLPSDHLIVDEESFRKTLKTACNFVEENEESVVTVGIRPNRPEIGYGYIQLRIEDGKSKASDEKYDFEQCIDTKSQTKENKEWTKGTIIEHFKVYKVERFVEKPDLERAKEYLNKGNFLWNGGMFIWKCSTILKLTHKYLKNTYEVLSEIINASEDNFSSVLEEKYPKVDSVSVDYGIMEKADDIYVIPSDFGWDDIGTWYAVERYREKDKNNNVCVGDIKSIDGKNNILFSKEKPIVVVGLEDVFVVESDDIIFVGKKKDIERIKEIKNKVY